VKQKPPTEPYEIPLRVMTREEAAKWAARRRTVYGRASPPKKGAARVGSAQWLIQAAEKGNAKPLAEYVELLPFHFDDRGQHRKFPAELGRFLAQILRRSKTSPPGVRSADPSAYYRNRTVAWYVTRRMRDEGVGAEAVVEELAQRRNGFGQTVDRRTTQRARRANPDLLDGDNVEAIIAIYDTPAGSCPPDPIDYA